MENISNNIGKNDKKSSRDQHVCVKQCVKRPVTSVTTVSNMIYSCEMYELLTLCVVDATDRKSVV